MTLSGASAMDLDRTTKKTKKITERISHRGSSSTYRQDHTDKYGHPRPDFDVVSIDFGCMFDVFQEVLRYDYIPECARYSMIANNHLR